MSKQWSICGDGIIPIAKSYSAFSRHILNSIGKHDNTCPNSLKASQLIRTHRVDTIADWLKANVNYEYGSEFLKRVTEPKDRLVALERLCIKQIGHPSQWAINQVLHEHEYCLRLLHLDLDRRPEPQEMSLDEKWIEEHVADEFAAIARQYRQVADYLRRQPEILKGLGEAKTPDAKTETPIRLANEPRDKWLYDQCHKLVPYETIKIRLAKKKSWAFIDSINGIKGAASRYAKNHGLDPIPKRQHGRPKAQ